MNDPTGFRLPVIKKPVERDMKLKDILSLMGGLVFAQFAAPIIFLDLPSIRAVKIKEIKERDAFTQEYVLHKGQHEMDSNMGYGS